MKTTVLILISTFHRIPLSVNETQLARYRSRQPLPVRDRHAVAQPNTTVSSRLTAAQTKIARRCAAAVCLTRAVFKLRVENQTLLGTVSIDGTSLEQRTGEGAADHGSARSRKPIIRAIRCRLLLEEQITRRS